MQFKIDLLQSQHNLSPEEKPCRAIRSGIPGKCLREHTVDITNQTRQFPGFHRPPPPPTPLLPAQLSIVPITQKVIFERRGVKQRLQHGVHETSVSQIIQSSQSQRLAGSVLDTAVQH